MAAFRSVAVKEIFESPDVRVVRHPGDGRHACVVTFSSLNVHNNGFGDAFFAKHGVPAIHLIARWNHWWQPPSVRAAIVAVDEVLEYSGRPPVMTYGSSMGGFGAALYARDLGARNVLMLAPQWSANPATPPHEKRWATEAKRIDFVHDDLASRLSPDAQKYLVFDPASLDAPHAAMFAMAPRTTLLPCVDGGHVIAHTLQQAGLLTDLVFSAMAGSLDVPGWRALWRDKRRKAGRFWYELGLRAARHRRPALSLHCLDTATSLRPQEVVFQLDYAYALLKRKQVDRSVEVFTAATNLSPDHPAPWRGLSIARRVQRQHRFAVEAAERGLALRPTSGDLRRVLTQALIEAGENGRALDAILPAVQAEPANADNRRLFDRARAALEAAMVRVTS